VTLAFKRGSADVQTIHITPSKTIVPDRQAIGISMDILGTLRLSPLNALLQGAVTTVDLLKNIVLGLWDFFGQVFRFKSSFSEVSGPIGIAKVVGQARSFGFVYVLSLMALISLNLAVINLVPFPALDGGRLLFVLIESVTRKNIPPKIASWTNGIGFALLLTLMIVISVHDVWGIL
jgi:regulator of sigma E protease